MSGRASEGAKCRNNRPEGMQLKTLGNFVKYKWHSNKGCGWKKKGGKRCGDPCLPGFKSCQYHLEMSANHRKKERATRVQDYEEIERVDYEKYILSDEWRAKSDAAKAAAGWKCQLCNRGRKDGVILNSHHRTYENLGNEQPGDLTVLCQDCHKLYEKSKKKRGLK